MSTTAYFWTHNRLESCEWSPSEIKPNHLASKGEPEGDSTGGPAAASHQRPTAEMCLHPHVTAFKKHECAHTCLLNKSETYQDPSKLLLFHPSGPRRQRSPASLSRVRSLSLSLSVSGMDSSASRPAKFGVFWGGRGSLERLNPRRVALSVSVPPSSVLLASVAEVASLLCANSALIQKLFYAVKRTRDRQRGVEGEQELGGRKG